MSTSPLPDEKIPDRHGWLRFTLRLHRDEHAILRQAAELIGEQPNTVVRDLIRFTLPALAQILREQDGADAPNQREMYEALSHVASERAKRYKRAASHVRKTG